MKQGDREAPPRERRIEVNGTVISASGLTVTSLSQVDPQSDFDSARGRGVELVGVEFKEVKLRLADGREIPARFILKDADLDLAFMAPEQPAELPAGGFPFVNLEDSASAAVLESLCFVARAPKSLQRVPLVRRSEVMGIVEKPRRFYLLTDQSLGSPVFTLQGKLLGITLLYSANGQRAPIALPAEDIAEMAKQAVVAQTAPAKSEK
jgi:S1-C subfamily serine protease